MADQKISELPVATVVNDADVVVLNQGGVTKQAARSLVKGVTATTVAANLATPVILTVSSSLNYLITGSGGQIIDLPNATTLQAGVIYTFNNNQSSGDVYIQNNLSQSLTQISPGGLVSIILLTKTAPVGTWERRDQAPTNVRWGTSTLDYPGSITNATWDGDVIDFNHGGTGQTTRQAALNALTGDVVSGRFLRGNGADVSMGLIQVTDLPVTLSQNTTGTASNVTGTVAIANGGTGATAAGAALINLGAAGTASVQVFTSGGTWTKPAGAKSVQVTLIGAGGGGGSGRRGASGTAISGGGGGAGGGYSFRTLDASILPGTIAVTVAAGGAGGAAVGADGTSGEPGGNGTMSQFGTFAFAAGGNGGGGGTNSPASGGSAASQRAMFGGGTGANSSVTVAASASSNTQVGGCGGGAGGGVSTTPAFLAGGAGAIVLSSFSTGSPVAGGTTDGASGSAGLSATLNYPATGSGGAGGAGSILGTGGTGGAGGNYGGGGGGGGGSLNGNNSGAGGKGGDGIVVVTSYF